MARFVSAKVQRRQFLYSSALGLGASLIRLPPGCGASRSVPVAVNGLLSDAQQNFVKEKLVEFAEQWEIPGLSLAMGFGGQLKLQGCCGWADRDRNREVEADHRFRVASVSKPLTSAALLKAAQEGKLDLQRPLFGTGGYLADWYDTANTNDPQQRRWQEAITADHLMHHTCGGWGNRKNDPMFRRDWLPLNQRKLIEVVLSQQKLEHEPGTNYDYSNFGYCLLGRLLEEIGEASYESVMRRGVLADAGADSMRVAQRVSSRRLAREVMYYQPGGDPYGAHMNVRRMDAHGGWVATPTELLRVGTHLDGRPNPKDVLDADSRRLMRQSSSANAGYACGWSINRHGNQWHFGSLPGTYSCLAIIADGHVWALLANTRRQGEERNEFQQAFDAFPWQIVRHVQGTWSEGDLEG